MNINRLFNNLKKESSMSSVIESIVQQLQAAAAKANKELTAARAAVKTKSAEMSQLNKALRTFGVKKVKKEKVVTIPKEIAKAISPAGKEKLRAFMKARHAAAKKAGLPYFDYLKAVREGKLPRVTGKVVKKKT